MRKNKFIIIFLSVFLIVGCTRTSKVLLSKNDIQIYMDNFNAINEIIENNRHSSNEWEEYIEKLRVHFDSYYFYFSRRDISYSMRKFRTEFNNIINYDAPKELNDIFKRIGWKKNGNKKFWTIYFACKLLWCKKQAKYDLEIGLTGAVLFFPLFLSSEMRIEFLKNMMKQIKEINKINRALNVINKYSLILINNKYEELTKMYIEFGFPE